MSEEKVFATYANTATKTKEKMEMHQSIENESTMLEESETTNEEDQIKCNNKFCYWYDVMDADNTNCGMQFPSEVKDCVARIKYNSDNKSPISLAEQEYLGPKESDNKPDWSIFPFDEAEFVLDAFAFGAKKYGAPFTYRKLVNPRKLLAATIRHLIAIQNDHEYADDSDCLHWAHVGANALMALSRYRKVKN